MRAEEVTVVRLVQGEVQFQVPLYQRTYSWQEEQLGQFWSDVRIRPTSLARTTLNDRGTFSAPSSSHRGS